MQKLHSRHNCLRHGVAWILVLSLRLAPVFAQVPDATIQRLVEINVEKEELRVLRASVQIPGEDYVRRNDAIWNEGRTLQQQINAFPASVRDQANQQIRGLTNARLAILAPQWQKQRAAFEKGVKDHRAAVAAAIPVDAQAALESQRRRLQLQQQRERGDITAETFTAEDKKALDQIMALRNKYVPEGSGFVADFDVALTRLTKALAAAPATPQPVAESATLAPAVNGPQGRITPQVKSEHSPAGDLSAANYTQDVVHVVDLRVKRNEVIRRFTSRETDSANYQRALSTIDFEVLRLSKKWQAVGKGIQFETDCLKRMATLEGAAPQETPGWWSSLTTNGILGISISVVVAGGIFLMFAVLFCLWVLKPRPAAPPKVSTIHGTAAFHPVTAGPQGHSGSGIFLGQSSMPRGKSWASPGGAPVFTKPENHTLIVARTRTGKGTRVIVPTLLRYRGSALVIDPKGENAVITGRFRRDGMGQKVHVLNPWNELADTFRGDLPSATYNPLDILEREDPNVVAVAQALAGAICPVASDGKDHFWQGSAGNILTAVFLWLTDQPEERKTLGRAREIVSLSRKDFTARFLVPMAASEAFDGAIRENAGPFIDMAQETYSGVMAQLSEDTKFLSDPQIKAATATSSFSMNDLIQGQTTVYLVIPTDRIDTQKTWLRLVLAASMYAFKRFPFSNRPQQRCLFMIDEFAALGRLADFPRDIATMSGYGVDFALVIQGLDQLKDHYGEAKGTILSNCAYKWFCNIGDLDTAKWLSDTLGKKTVRTESTSESSSSSGNGGSSSSSVSHSETGRSLFNPDEILNLGRDVAIALHPEGNPHYLRTIDYWNLEDAFAELEGQHPDIFWVPPLGYDANPYNKESSSSRGGSRNLLPSPDEARLMLEVGPGATAGEIHAAHARQQARFPDVGDSHPLIIGINIARDVLLRERE